MTDEPNKYIQMQATPGKLGLSQTISDKKTDAVSHSNKKSFAREEYSDLVVINDDTRNNVKSFNNVPKNAPAHYFNTSTTK